MLATRFALRTLAAVAVAAALATPALADDGTDFGPQVKMLFRVGACGSDDALPARMSAKVVDAHCAKMQRVYASHHRAWADKAGPYIAKIQPSTAPTTVVYPFGGGDLTSALVVFPNATEITTLSLEAPGDVRAIDKISKEQLAADLGVISHDIERLYRSAYSTTKSLQESAYSELPGTLMFALAGLAHMGYEPLALRYFDINPDGSLTYLSNAELDKRVAAVVGNPKTKQRYKNRRWTDMESVFANVEIQFKKRGDANAPVKTYRHILANLDDAHLNADHRVLAHLEKKGKVSVMTKAASFLLWFDDFSNMRDYLSSHIAWMISDASGLPPSFATQHGLEQTTYGTFVGPYFIQDPHNTRSEMISMWKKQPERKLPFRFGYPDAEDNNHLMITQPKS
ncbi:MAG TPA: hypothetical protein VGM90_32005 [Kofleriaceae bacterium]